MRVAFVAQNAAVLDGRGRAAADAAHRGFTRGAAKARARGVTTLATALYRSRPLDEAGNDFPGGLCVVIGSEGQGLTDATVEACDMAVRIPMTDRVESLNAAVAGSVLLWHFRGV